MGIVLTTNNTKPKSKPKQTETKQPKLKKGQTILDLIDEARRLVNEKLGEYKDLTECILTVEELKQFFAETEELIAIDTETTGLNTFSDQLVGISLCNGKRAIYIPIRHKSAIYGTILKGQAKAEEVIEVFREEIKNPKYKWIYHNSKFDLLVLRTFLGFDMPNPFHDTMLVAYLLNQDEEHSLKYQYNKYIAEEDERSK